MFKLISQMLLNLHFKSKEINWNYPNLLNFNKYEIFLVFIVYGILTPMVLKNIRECGCKQIKKKFDEFKKNNFILRLVQYV